MLRNLTYALLTMGVVSILPTMNIGQTASADDWDDRWEDYQEAREEYYEDYYDDLEDYYDDWDDHRWHRVRHVPGYRAPVYRHHTYYRAPAHPVYHHHGCAPVPPVPCCR